MNQQRSKKGLTADKAMSLRRSLSMIRMLLHDTPRAIKLFCRMRMSRTRKCGKVRKERDHFISARFKQEEASP